MTASAMTSAVDSKSSFQLVRLNTRKQVVSKIGVPSAGLVLVLMLCKTVTAQECCTQEQLATSYSQHLILSAVPVISATRSIQTRIPQHVA